MSKVVKCDGCGKTSRQKPKEWLIVDVRNGGNAPVAEGDFCTADCLARFIASDSLDKQIKRGERPR